MLILGRRIGQKIIINGEIKIYLIDIQDNYAKLGFEAPESTVIDREEIHIRKLKQLTMESEND